MKLTSAQQRVVDLMRDGWELRTSKLIDRAHVRKHTERGVERETVPFPTYSALFYGMVIEPEYSNEHETLYRLTEQWKGTNGDK